MSPMYHTYLKLACLTLCLAVAAESCSRAEDAPVAGTFKANGKDTKLAYITALKGEPYLDKPTTILVMTEKDHSKEKKPDFMAGFGKFGNALVITLTSDGKIVGCEVVHSALKRGTFSSVGNMEAKDIKTEAGKLQGTLTTSGERKAFDETWEVNLTFRATAP